MNFKMAYLFLVFFFLKQFFAQEFVSSQPGARVLDPFSTRHRVQKFVAGDTLNKAHFTLSYEALFGMSELQKIEFGSEFKFMESAGGALQVHFLQWGPFTNIESNNGVVYYMPELLSALMINLKYRYYHIERVYLDQSFQLDLSGTIYVNPNLDLIWSIKNIFEWDTEGPTHGSLAGCIVYTFCPELCMRLGLEKSYLYPMNNWAAISGVWKGTLSYGVSYLSLEDEYSAFMGIKVKRYQLEAGVSHHRELGQSYRSGISIYF